MNKKPESRPTIGLLIGQIDGRYQSALWPAVRNVAQKNNVNLMVFTGKSLNSPNMFEAQHNIVYNLPCKNTIDGLVIVSGSLGNYVSYNVLKDFCYRYQPLPMVNIAMPVENIPTVMVDNKSGMRQIITHFIKDHGYRKIAFIRGPEQNTEAELRYRGYREILKENNIPFDPKLVTTGNFVHQSGFNAVETLFDKRKVKIDAIAAANDDMLLGLHKALKMRKIRIPEDIAIAGFDNIDEARFMNPPMTTVDQPLYKQAVIATEMLIKMIAGESVPQEIILPVKMLIRKSCGCNDDFPIEMAKKIESSIEITTSNIDRFVQEKEAIIDTILTDIKNPYESHKEIRNWVSRLFDSCISDIKNLNKDNTFKGTCHILLNKEILTADKNNRAKIIFWKTIFFNLKTSIFSYIKTDDKLLAKTNYLFQKAYLLIAEALEHRHDSQRINMRNTIWKLRKVSQTLSSTFNIKTLIDLFADELPMIKISSCCISLYEKEKFKFEKINNPLPLNSKIIFAYQNGKRQIIYEKQNIFTTMNIIPDKYKSNKSRYTKMIFPLLFHKEQFGFICFETGPDEPIIYETLREQISSALNSALLIEAREKAEYKLIEILQKLEQSNSKLRNLSRTDELTGLYNRRGFMTLGKQQVKLAQRKSENFMIFYIDLDGLKIINDTYGHSEGDKAIIKTAKLIKDSFRESDIIARIGGDEFTTLSINTSSDPENSINKIMVRLKDSFKKNNTKSKKPYNVTISIGVISFKDYPLLLR
ncbi:MAG: GGDEF domain-containing protein [Spirochaetes bacterium]|nr:GGDEF domain-containing protein [Spirochaetota bacterium]